jgi:hypothetical protein
MAENGQTTWHIKGDEVANCNCVWACPCQFNGLPDKGHCEAIVTYRVREGQFGDTDLAGVAWSAVVAWPGAIHEGDGTIQLVIDEGASEEQREAVKAMTSGENGGTYFEIFASVIPHVREPIYAPIELATDPDTRHASVRIEGLAEAKVEPITNPVTGDELRVRIDLPDGFEYEIAEIANSVSTRVDAEAPLALDLENSYAQLNEFDWSNAG